MTIQEKSQKTLEFPAILTLLANSAVSTPAKERSLATLPSTELDDIQTLQDETTAALHLYMTKGVPSFGGLTDVKLSLDRAYRGGTLNTTELLHIAVVLERTHSAISYRKEDSKDTTVIDYLFDTLTGDKSLHKRIRDCILGENEIADGASGDLADIRRKLKNAAAKIQDTLRKMISSSSYANALQDALVTQRGGRYVVPVKIEHRGQVEGMVHDSSSSGQTLFVEPKAVVDLNNEIRELEAKEQMEIERILAELSALAADRREDILNDYELLIKLDVIFARAKLSVKLNCHPPQLVDGGGLFLKKARHPLIDPKKVVANDIFLGNEFDTLIITGPNTGGKTVSIKTLGLLCLMANCGLHIPAGEESIVPVFSEILADIGDEQSIEQSLSTFSAHMTNIVGILERAKPKSLLLFDELGAGTDPTEGAALGIAIIEHARGKGARVAATTHYAELKLYATSTPGVINAACEFNIETLAPTYRLFIGVPGKSNAFAIAKRLGLKDEILDDATRHIDRDKRSFEEALAALDVQHQAIQQEKEQADKLLADAKEDKEKSDKLRVELEEIRKHARIQATKEAEEIISDARRVAEEAYEEVKRIGRENRKNPDWNKVNQDRAALNRKFNEAEGKLGQGHTQERQHSRPIKVGDTVRLGLGSHGEVISVKDDVLTLQVGIMKVTAKSGEVELIENAKKQDFHRVIAKSEAKLRAGGTKPEVDLRGMMVEEAVVAAEQFIDTALLSRLETVSIIHGKGTGALRKAIHESLKRNKFVKSFRLGRYGEGEDGVTIVTMK